MNYGQITIHLNLYTVIPSLNKLYLQALLQFFRSLYRYAELRTTSEPYLLRVCLRINGRFFRQRDAGSATRPKQTHQRWDLDGRAYFTLGVSGLFILFSTLPVNAQTSLNVPISDPVYHALDLFVAHDLIDPVMVGQRPFSRLEIARQLSLADIAWKFGTKRSASLVENGNHSTNDYISQQLSYWLRDYDQDIKKTWSEKTIAPIKWGRYQINISSAKARDIMNDTGMGKIDGVISTFDANNQGRSYRQGLTSYFESHLEMRFSPHFTLLLEPQIELASINNSVDRIRVAPFRAYAQFGGEKLNIQVGRDELIWGQGEFGGLLRSANVRPMGMIKIGNPHPWRWPWLFNLAGPTRITVFVATLGPERTLEYAYLYGGKISFQPWRSLEIGFSQTIIMGGKGAPEVSLLEAFTEFFPIHKFARNTKYRDIGDHLFGFFDLRWTIAALRNSAIYWESSFDDSPARALPLPGNLLNQMNIQTGIFIPRLNDAGTASLRLEYQHTAPWAYRHGRWVTGHTLNKRTLGSALGPDADGIYAVLRYQPGTNISGTFRIGYEIYRNDIYFNDGAGSERVLLNTNRDDERRYRFQMASDWRKYTYWSFDIQAAFEYVGQFNFTPANNRFDALLGMGVTYTLGSPH